MVYMKTKAEYENFVKEYRWVKKVEVDGSRPGTIKVQIQRKWWAKLVPDRFTLGKARRELSEYRLLGMVIKVVDL